MHSNGEASGPGGGFAHQALIYASDQEFMEVALPFVEGGLTSNEPTLIAVQDRHIENLRGALAGTPDGVTLYAVEEWYETSARTRAKFAGWVAEHTDSGGRARLMGEPPWALGHEAQVRDWARHESVINVAFADQAATFICPYDARALPDEVLGHAVDTHPEIVQAGGVPASGSYEDPLAFCRRLDADIEPQHGDPSIQLSFGLEDLSVLRRLVGSFALDADLPPARTKELVLAVNEIATNAVIHGSAPATLRAWHSEDEIVIEVHDTGEGVQNVLAGQLPPPIASLEGRGLWLTRQLCDAVELRDGEGCTVVMHAAAPGALVTAV
jgi:anti-sigma regulatory factor (Ser/Thr protein kinase)